MFRRNIKTGALIVDYPKIFDQLSKLSINELLLHKNRDLLNKLIDKLNKQDSNGHTLLHKACYYNQVNMVKFLCQMGADTNLTNKDGYNALYYLCKIEGTSEKYSAYDRKEMGQCLIQHNANGQLAWHLETKRHQKWVEKEKKQMEQRIEDSLIHVRPSERAKKKQESKNNLSCFRENITWDAVTLSFSSYSEQAPEKTWSEQPEFQDQIKKIQETINRLDSFLVWNGHSKANKIREALRNAICAKLSGQFSSIEEFHDYKPSGDALSLNEALGIRRRSPEFDALFNIYQPKSSKLIRKITS